MAQRRNAIYIVIVVSLLAGLITGQTFFFKVSYAFIGLFVLSFLWAWSGVNWLRLSRQTRARRAQVGRYMEERFSIKNASILPKLWLEIYDESNLPGHRASHVVSNIGSRSGASWLVRTLCVRRGEFQLGPLRVVTGDPFGLFEVERAISATSRLVVYPSTVELHEFALPIGLLPGGDAIRRRTHHVTTNAAGVREYAPGDSFNRIHWRMSARQNKLMVKEFELDPLADIWIVMDSERTVHFGDYASADADAERMPWETDRKYQLPPTTEEYCVTAVASLARYFLQKNRSVGFATYAQRHETIQVDRGARQMTKILETLALIRARGVMPLEQLLSLEGNLMTRGTTVIIVTSSTREEWVTATHHLLQRGLRVIGVLVDPEGFGGRPGMRHIKAQLASLAIPTYTIEKGDDLQVALGHQR